MATSSGYREYMFRFRRPNSLIDVNYKTPKPLKGYYRNIIQKRYIRERNVDLHLPIFGIDLN